MAEDVVAYHRPLFREQEGASDSRIASARQSVQSEPEDARAGGCVQLSSTRSCLVSEPPHTERVQLHWLPAKPRIPQTARIAQFV